MHGDLDHRGKLRSVLKFNDFMKMELSIFRGSLPLSIISEFGDTLNEAVKRSVCFRCNWTAVLL